MHRTPVLPDLPCEAPWLHDDFHRGKPDVCKAPLTRAFEGAESPQGLAYAVDAGGQLVGGWVRPPHGAPPVKVRAVRGPEGARGGPVAATRAGRRG